MPEEGDEPARPERAISGTAISMPRTLLKISRYKFLFIAASLHNFRVGADLVFRSARNHGTGRPENKVDPYGSRLEAVADTDVKSVDGVVFLAVIQA
ncbi:Uncharacterised protein [Klebsiella pneumoniae]|nr:Uncharacterised protein [Klebsiella pneumoniae]